MTKLTPRANMAASFNPTLQGVGEQITAAVAESPKHLQIDGKGPSASSIGEEVGKNISAVLDAALSKFKKPDASSLREQILANADAILNLYNGETKRYITGFMLTVTGTGEQTEALLVAKVAKGDNPSLIFNRLGSLVIIQGRKKGSDIDALLALHDDTKMALVRARSQAWKNARSYGLPYAFSNFADLRS